MSEDGRNRTWTRWAVAILCIVEIFVLDGGEILRHPWRYVGLAALTAAIVVAVLAAVTAFRRRVLSRVPERFTNSPSRPVRVATKIGTGYAAYLVGFYTVIAVIGVITVIQHFA